MSWIRQLAALADVLKTPKFWYTLLGILAALLVWFYLLYLAIEQFDRRPSLHSAVCGGHLERNWHMLALVMCTPLFLVGLLGVIAEWMTYLDNRAKGRRTTLKPLMLFLLLMQVTAMVILLVMEC